MCVPLLLPSPDGASIEGSVEDRGRERGEREGFLG